MADNTSLGIFNTNHFSADLVVKDFASGITRYMPNGTAPLFAITSRLGEATALNWMHGYFAKTMVFPEFRLAANIDTTQTTFTVVSTESLVEGQTFELFETKEQVMLSRILSPTSISVVRAMGSTAQAISFATEVPDAYLVGNAHEEGSLRPNALALNPVQITNLTQIFRNTWAVTGTAAAVKVIAGDTTVAENKQDAGAFHATAIESALLFGKKSQGQRNGQPFRTMDGFINITANPAYYPSTYPTPNIYTAGNTTNANQLENMLDPVFNQVTDPAFANKRLIFTGGAGIRVLNQIGMLNGEYKLVDNQTNWGLQFKTMQFARGEFTLIEHPLLNSNPNWAKMALVMDVGNLRLAYLAGRKTEHKYFNTGSQGMQAVDNGIDAMGGTLTTEVTLEVRNPPAGAVIYNLTAAAKNA